MEKIKEFILRIQRLFSNLSDQNKLTLTVMSLIGVGLGLEWYAQLQRTPESIHEPRTLIARINLEKGTVLNQLGLTTMIINHKDTEGAFTDQDLEIVLGSKLKRAVRRGEPIRYRDIEISPLNLNLSEKIPSNYIAYSFISESDLPIHIGDKVDLLVSSNKRNPVSGVEILDIKRSEKGQTLVVAIKENDLPDLEKAQQSGKIGVVLRSKKDSLKRRSERKQPQKQSFRKVQILEEGD